MLHKDIVFLSSFLMTLGLLLFFFGNSVTGLAVQNYTYTEHAQIIANTQMALYGVLIFISLMLFGIYFLLRGQKEQEKK